MAPQKDLLNLQQRTKEYEYFHKIEEDLIERLRASLAADQARQGLAEATGVADQAALSLLHELGYDRETVRSIHLVPLLWVAWSDGSVSPQESALIRKAASSRGITPGSAAAEKLERLLASQPTSDFFEKSRVVIRALLAVLPESERKAASSSLFEQSRCIAQASGGFLGFGSKLSTEEQETLEALSQDVQATHSAASEQWLATT